MTPLAGCDGACLPGRVCILVGTGELGFNGDGLPGLETRVASPMSVQADPDGGLSFVDFSSMRIRGLDEQGLVQTLVGNGSHAFSIEGASALETPLENPFDARWSDDGTLYIAPFHEGRIVRIVDGVVQRVACTGASLQHGGDGGDALNATMGYPGGIAFGDDGSLYMSDWTNSRVRRVGSDGIIETVVGTDERGFDAAGFGPEVRLDHPTMLDFDSDGFLLITDGGNDRIARLDVETLAVTTVAGTGSEGYDGDGGPATDAALSGPLAVLANPEGGFWVADSGNDVVREVSADGTITTVAGDPEGDEVVGNAPALGFRLETPVGMGLSPEGDLWIAERDGQRIVQWSR